MIEVIASAEAATAVQAATEVATSGITGNLTSAMGGFAGAIGVGLIGYKACESVGRNPEASGKVLIQSILAMALAEGVAILCLLMG
jgi:F-type H+-transporting ATPase subunit c